MSRHIVMIMNDKMGHNLGRVIYRGNSEAKAREVAEKHSKRLGKKLGDRAHEIEARAYNPFTDARGVRLETQTYRNGKVISSSSQILFLEDMAVLATCFADTRKYENRVSRAKRDLGDGPDEGIIFHEHGY